MKPAVRFMSIITTVWTIFVILLIVLLVISILPRIVIRIDPPPPDEWTVTITNETASASNNFSVYNGGLFPLRDFVFAVEINSNNTTLAEIFSNKTTIQAGSTARIPITLEINRTNIEGLRLETMLFSNETFGGLVYFDMKYIFTFQAQMAIGADVTIGPLIHRVNFDANNTTLSQNGTNSTLGIPYSLNSSAIWSGRNISLSGTLSNDTQVLGTINQSIPLGKSVHDELVVNLTQGAFTHLSTSSDHLIWNLTLTVANYSRDFQVEREWQPPSQGGVGG